MEHIQDAWLHGPQVREPVEGIVVALQGGMLKLKPSSDWMCGLGQATWPFFSSGSS